MAVKITYMVHGTTLDNVNHLASGQNDIVLAERGEKEALDLGAERKDDFDVIISSDLKRAVDTAKLAFGDRCVLVQDIRLRECDYGELTQKPKNWDIKDYISKKYPNGESYLDVQKRISEFLDFLEETYDGKHVGIVSHQAPQLALEVLTKGISWEDVIDSDWRKIGNWQPGWEYVLG